MGRGQQSRSGYHAALLHPIPQPPSAVMADSAAAALAHLAAAVWQAHTSRLRRPCPTPALHSPPHLLGASELAEHYQGKGRSRIFSGLAVLGGAITNLLRRESCHMQRAGVPARACPPLFMRAGQFSRRHAQGGSASRAPRGTVRAAFPQRPFVQAPYPFAPTHQVIPPTTPHRVTFACWSADLRHSFVPQHPTTCPAGNTTSWLSGKSSGFTQPAE